MLLVVDPGVLAVLTNTAGHLLDISLSSAPANWGSFRKTASTIVTESGTEVEEQVNDFALNVEETIVLSSFPLQCEIDFCCRSD